MAIATCAKPKRWKAARSAAFHLLGLYPNVLGDRYKNKLLTIAIFNSFNKWLVQAA
jgi:hypothetical protein